MNPAARVRTPQFWFVLILFAVLVGLAHVGAEMRARKDSQTQAAIEQRTPKIWQEQEGEIPAPHSLLYYRIVLSIWVAVVLLTVALSFYALARPGAPSNYWVLFWTFSYLAYLVHFYWSAGVLYGWNFSEILNSKIGVNPDPEKVVCNPIP